MPAVAPYIPAKDAALNNWLANFSTLITAAPPTYGLVTADATAIAAAVAAWLAAYTPTTSASTKTAAAVASKNTAKFTVLAIIRPYAQQVGNNAGVTSANKIALGLNPKTSTPSPVTPPASNPILTVQSAANLSIILRYRDSAGSVSVKSKPYGVKSCQIFCLVSATPVTDPTVMLLKATATKSPLTVTFNSGDAGKQAYFAARWAIQTGQYSPWSPIVNFTVPAGS
jgi:hypothetical protein